MATNPLLRELRAGRLDLVVGTLPVERGVDLEVFPVYTREASARRPPGASARAQARLSFPRRSPEHPFISFHEGANTRRIIEAVLAEHGVSPRVTMTTDSPEAIRNLAAAGLGHRDSARELVRDDIAAGGLVEIRIGATRLRADARLDHSRAAVPFLRR